ncbi:hypothetical protein ACSFXN_04765 [Planococcus sp. 1R117A]|uniref:hypothetical protein n=1 Tax=Planococcus sp. 1R117A TaxID=3447020 RepID=UPI003EDBE4BA
MEHDHEIDEKIKRDNYKVFDWLSNYLNNAPDFIGKEEIDEIVGAGVSSEYAFAVILAAAFGLDIVDNPIDKAVFHNYFNKIFHKLEASEYANNPYYQNIKIPRIQIGNSELKYEKYKPFEGFVSNDIIRTTEGRQIPQVGFFETEFHFPAVLENGRIWMTITPNEIETMKEPIEQAFGKVLTFGLGLGYYAYMVSEKDNVDSVTPNRSGHETPVGPARAEDPGANAVSEAAKAVPTESEVAGSVGIYTVLFIPNPLCLQSEGSVH